MKHKRQTLSKQNDDGDDKESVSSDGAKSTKLSDKLLLGEDASMSKKSCQGCEMPPGTHGIGDETLEHSKNSSRVNNNNTPSATNNNSYNSNSSVASSGSFDKISEDDSLDDLQGTRKKSVKEESPVKIAGDKLKVAYNNQRASPTTATAIASATVTIQNSAIPAFVARGASNFQNYPSNFGEYASRSNKHNQQYQQQCEGFLENHEGTSGEHYYKEGRRNTYHQTYQNHNYYGYKRNDPYASSNHQINYQYQPDQTYQNNHHYVYPNNMTYNSGDNTNYYPNDLPHKASNYYDYPHQESSYIPNPTPSNNSDHFLIAGNTNCPTESPETYPSTFHQFYDHQGHSQHPENSNSSSDFNFLSNIANEFTPEYYQI